MILVIALVNPYLEDENQLRQALFCCLDVVFPNQKLPVMPILLPKQDIKDFDDYRHWLCNSGHRYYEEVWSFKNKETVLQEYLAVCYAKKMPARLNEEDNLTISRIVSKN